MEEYFELPEDWKEWKTCIITSKRGNNIPKYKVFVTDLEDLQGEYSGIAWDTIKEAREEAEKAYAQSVDTEPFLLYVIREV